MKAKHNKTLLVLGILTLAFLIAYVLFFALTVTSKGGEIADVFGAMKDAMGGVGFKRLFAPAGGTGFDVAYCIVNYLLIGLIFIFSIYSIYLFAKTKHVSLIFGIIFAILALGPAWGFMLGAIPEEPTSEYRAFIFDTLFKNKYEANDSNTLIIIMTWLYLIFLIFAFCLSISFFVLAIIHARKNRYVYSEKAVVKETNEPNDEASILAELEEEPFPDEPEQKDQPVKTANTIADEAEEDDYFDDYDDEDEDEEEIVCNESDFRNIIQDIIKEAVKSELEKRDADRPNQANQQPPMQQGSGLNNGGPIIVQYFNNNSDAGKPFQPTNQPYPYAPYPYPYAPYPYAPYPYPYPPQPQPQPAPQQPIEPAKPAEPAVKEEPVKEPEKEEEKQVEIPPEKQEEKVEEIVSEEPVQEEVIEPEIIAEEEPSQEPEKEPEIEAVEEPQQEVVEPAPVEEIVPEPEPVEEPQPEPEPEVEIIPEEPVVEEPQPEAVEEPQQEVVEPATVEEQANEEAANEEENPNKIVRIPFYERILTVDKELQDLYSELKNELLSYGLKSRVAANGDTFRLHRKTYCRISVAGKSLKLHLALNPDDYKDSKMPYADAGNKATYADIPFVFKVKSGLSLRRAKGLIADACAKEDLIQVDLMTTDWVKELRENKDKVDESDDQD